MSTLTCLHCHAATTNGLALCELWRRLQTRRQPPSGAFRVPVYPNTTNVIQGPQIGDFT